MNQANTKHIVFHALTAIYFIWLLVLLALISLIFYEELTSGSIKASVMLLPTLFINLIFGAMLVFIIRMLGNNKNLAKFVRISYYAILTISLISASLSYFL